jgi:hypothetical protein
MIGFGWYDIARRASLGHTCAHGEGYRPMGGRDNHHGRGALFRNGHSPNKPNAPIVMSGAPATTGCRRRADNYANPNNVIPRSRIHPRNRGATLFRPARFAR